MYSKEDRPRIDQVMDSASKPEWEGPERWHWDRGQDNTFFRVTLLLHFNKPQAFFSFLLPLFPFFPSPLPFIHFLCPCLRVTSKVPDLWLCLSANEVIKLWLPPAPCPSWTAKLLCLCTPEQGCPETHSRHLSATEQWHLLLRRN